MKLIDNKFIQRRGELLTQQLLLELGAKYVAEPGPEFGVDYLATFDDESGGTKVIGVEVRATESGTESFEFNLDQLRRLSKINLPVLLVITNVKQNTTAIAWARESMEELAHRGVNTQTVRLRLRNASREDLADIRDEILRR